MEKILARNEVYRGRVLSLEVLEVRTAAGVRTRREVVRHGGAVAILAVTPARRLLLVRQYRVAVGREMTEIVAGIRDRAGESPEDCARRELREETGYEAEELVRLGEVYPSPGYITECIQLFAARLRAGPGATALDHDEELHSVEIPPQEFRDMLRRGEIRDGKTLAAWSLFREHGLEELWLQG